MLSDVHILRWLIALIGLVFVLGVLVMLAQRYGQNLRRKFGVTLRMVEQMALDSRYKVVIFEDGEARHTLVLGPQQATALARTPLAPKPARKLKKKK